MIVWSNLTERAWDQLQRKGRLRASRRHTKKDFSPPTTGWPDRWNVGCTFQGRRRLRCRSGYGSSGRTVPDGGRTFGPPGTCRKGPAASESDSQVQDDCVLLSDFDLWHYVLNYWYLPRTKKDGEAFERKLARAGLSPVGCNHGNPPHKPDFAERSRRVGNASSTCRGLTQVTESSSP